jgi:hypothetical protein
MEVAGGGQERRATAAAIRVRQSVSRKREGVRGGWAGSV